MAKRFLTPIQFDTSSTVTPSVGQITWDADFGTAQVGLQGGNVTLQLGQEHLVRVKNASGSVAIAKGKAVMFAGATGDTVTVSPADASNAFTIPSDYFVGITSEEIPADGFGFVAQFGFVNQIDTSAFTLGALLYVSASTPGELTSTQPAAPAWQTPIAAVTRVNATSGRILVRAIPGINIKNLEGVSITSPSSGQVLSYDGSKWVNSTASGSGTVTSVALSVPVGLTVSGSPITGSGTLAVSYDTGYAIPTTAKQTEWDTAYGWGNHASAGYLLSSTAATTYQPLDSVLTSLSAITPTTNDVLYFINSSTASTFTVSSTARTLLDDSSTNAMRSTLGLAIGSDVQAYDADLSAIAGLAGTSGFLTKTAANTWSLDTTTYLTQTVADGLYASIVGKLVRTTNSSETTSTALVSAYGSTISGLEANTLYHFRQLLVVSLSFGSATVGARLGFTFSNAQQSFGSTYVITSTTSTGTSTFRTSPAVYTAQSFTGNTTCTIYCDGYFKTNATTGGSIDPGFAMAGTAGGATVLAGSYFELRKV